LGIASGESGSLPWVFFMHSISVMKPAISRGGFGTEHHDNAVIDRLAALAIAVAFGLGDLVEARLGAPEIEIDAGFDEAGGDQTTGPSILWLEAVFDLGEDRAAVGGVVRWMAPSRPAAFTAE
jgi:hypothetical protein